MTTTSRPVPTDGHPPRPYEDLRALPASALRRRCDPARLGFATTAELEPLESLLGQTRAVEAIHFGLGMRGEGYNLFVLGPEGTGRHTLVQRLLGERAIEAQTPSDWCYVNNFAEPRRPLALELPAGRGAELRADLERLVEEAAGALKTELQSEAHRARKSAIDEGLKAERVRLFEAAQARAKEKGVAVIQTADGIALLPLREGRVVEPDEFGRLPDEERESFAGVVRTVRTDIHEMLHRVGELEAKAHEEASKLDREVTEAVLARLVDRLRRAHADLPRVLAWLEGVQADMVEHASELLEPASAPGDVIALAIQHGLLSAPSTRRYRVNLLVDRRHDHGAPVVYEDRPALHNLLGRIEHAAQFGALVTDFNMVRAGVLHRANGGYLVLDAARLLVEPHAWSELKRVLRAHAVRVQSLPEILGLGSTESLEPEPIPFDGKVVLVGERLLYYLLGDADPEFQRLFKVAAEMDDEVDGPAENDLLYVRLLAGLAREAGTRPLDAPAAARVVEEGRRMAGDAAKLSTNLDRLSDLLRESDHFAERADRDAVAVEDVRCAVDAQRRRAMRLEERLREEIRRGHVVIETEGRRIGQVNGLSLLQLGRHAFGRPVRITARVRLGRGEVVDIEREAHLGGDLHSKGVMILTGFLTTRYVTDAPLSLGATLTFEQSYGGVEGDSASLAELCALLSAVGALPMPQAIAMTGSVDQHGKVQAVGGVNEKIEGFFDVCRERRPQGPFGVILPRANVDHLMLREDVVAAAAEGWMRVYPVESVDQAMEVLTGLPSGVRDPSGRFPPGTVNHLIQSRLERFTERARSYLASRRENNGS